jgi:hypothetical protein
MYTYHHNEGISPDLAAGVAVFHKEDAMRRWSFLLLTLLALAACQAPGGPSRNFAGLQPTSANCYDSGSSANLGGLAAAGVLLGAAAGASGFERFALL